MKNSISKRDWETISAYLDRQLSQREQARFESRLHNDHQLQAALDDMRQTRQVLRSALVMRAPRNFLLTPEIAGTPIRIPRLAPVFGWASAVASFLLILVLVGDFFTDGRFAPVDMISFQQNEFIIQRNEISESDVWVQPAISGDVSVFSESIDNSQMEAAPPEMRAQVAPVDTGADVPTMETAILEEASVAESQESELLAMKNAEASEEPSPENPEGVMAAAGEGVSTGDLPIETPVESNDEGSNESQDEAGVMAQSSVDLTEDAADANQVETETGQDSPTETVEIEGILVQEMVEEIEQPIVTAAETAIIADQQMSQKEQLASGDDDTTISNELMAVETVTELEPVTYTETALKNGWDLILGIEVILALGALGTGLAWIYTRRRVG